MELVFLELGGTIVELVEVVDGQRFEDGVVNHLALRVADIFKAIEHLQAHQVEMTSAEPMALGEGRYNFFFRGPSGEKLNYIRRSIIMQQKRYHTFNEHLRERFGGKIFKVSLDAGFTCPNRDGTLGRGGCVYCSERGSGDFAGEQGLSLHNQFIEVTARMKKKWPNANYIAYFQAYTNTYAPAERLHEVYEEALAEEKVVGLAISTKPDCLPENVLDYLGGAESENLFVARTRVAKYS